MEGFLEDLSGMKVLLVDDTPDNIEILTCILKKEKFDISVATNGELALRALENEKPDLILLDVMMPVLNGFDTCKIIKEDPDTKDIPIIFVTAKVMIEDVLKGFQLGGVDYIEKPYNNNEILSRVKTHLRIQKLIKEKALLNEKLNEQNFELIESQNQYRIFLENSVDGVFKLDAQGRITDCNAKFFEKLGFKREDMYGKPIMEFINSESPEKIEKEITTKRFGDRAAKGLRVQFCVNENAPLWQEKKYYTMLLDAYGIWNLPNNVIHEKGIEKNFRGTMCIAKLPLKTTFPLP